MQLPRLSHYRILPTFWRTLFFVAALTTLSGCNSLHQWWHNGFKLGPDFCQPPAPVADRWLDESSPAVQSDSADIPCWWTMLNDPVLDELIANARRQNLPLQAAALRVVEARAERGIAAGNLFPQQQQMTGHYTRNSFSENGFPFGVLPIRNEYDDWRVGFDASWELDVWGRLRRAIESADANVCAQIDNYRDVLVILQAEVAATYVQLRTVETRLSLARENVTLQKDTLKIVDDRFSQGVVSELDVRQARSAVAATESLIPMLEQSRRKLRNALCVLLGMPPHDLNLDRGPRIIPEAPAEIVVGIPAELLRRRPDIRRAEEEAAAGCARIGIAVAELYPHFSISGNIALNSEYFSDLFRGDSLAGSIGPNFRWNILNYGRIRNNICVEDARFRQLVLTYQQTVLKANQEVEDGIVAFLREKERVQFLAQSAAETRKAVDLAILQYHEGIVDYQRVLDTERALVVQQEALAGSRGQVALNLVAVYKALGGGWQMPSELPPVALPFSPEPLEEVPAPVE